MRGRVWVGLDEIGITEIFRSYGQAVQSAAGKLGNIKEYPRKDAVFAIRTRVFQKSDNHCKDCGNIITWNFHMHEETPRGKGGNISIWNSIALCANCHLNFEHGNRRLRFNEPL